MSIVETGAVRVHIGIGGVIEKTDVNKLRAQSVPVSRRCAANIPQNLNDMWWRQCSVEQPPRDIEVILRNGHWMPQPEPPK